MYLIRFPEGEKKENVAEVIYEEIMTDNFCFISNNNPQNQGDQVPQQGNKKAIPKHIIVKP